MDETTLLRRQQRTNRRREKAATAETPTEQLTSGYDYLRGQLARLEKKDRARADELRKQIAAQLVTAGDRIGRMLG